MHKLLMTRWGERLFTGLGYLLMGGALFGVLFSVVRWWGAERTEGTVVAVETRSDSDGNSFYPVVEYVVAGQRLKCDGTFGFNPPVYRVGERVPVLYHPKQPTDSIIDKFAQRWGGQTI